MRVLVLDIGGSHVKVFVPGRKVPVEIESGRHMTPRRITPIHGGVNEIIWKAIMRIAANPGKD